MKGSRMNIFHWFFAYGVVYAFFQVMPAFIHGKFVGPVSRSDAFDFLTPLAVIPVALAVFFKLRKLAGTGGRGSLPYAKSSAVIFVLGLICYVEGHGLHLSANAVDRLLGGQENTALHQSVYIFDEVISHLVWDGGVLFLAAGLILAGKGVNLPPSSWTQRLFLAGGGVFFGFSYAVNAIEGQTLPVTLPAAVFIALICLRIYTKGRKRGEYNAAALFFLTAFVLAVLLFAYWGIAHPGFPEFSELGWI
jgi:hypothetical protein